MRFLSLAEAAFRWRKEEATACLFTNKGSWRQSGCTALPSPPAPAHSPNPKAHVLAAAQPLQGARSRDKAGGCSPGFLAGIGGIYE